jgi:hypothetical protein
MNGVNEASAIHRNGVAIGRRTAVGTAEVASHGKAQLP